MYAISKKFDFSASHRLDNLPKDHPCSRVHGHNYVVIVKLQSNALDEVGFVVDYRKLSPIKEFLDNHLDHRDLNEVIDFNPSAENLAKYIFITFNKVFPNLVAVTVKETDKTTATYSPMFDENPDKI